MEIRKLENGNLLITIPMVLVTCGKRKQIVSPESDNVEVAPLVTNIARAFHWQKLIDSGQFQNIKELAAEIGVDSTCVAKTVRLALLSPQIIHKIITGELRPSVDACRESFPESWEEQEAFFADKG